MIVTVAGMPPREAYRGEILWLGICILDAAPEHARAASKEIFLDARQPTFWDARTQTFVQRTTALKLRSLYKEQWLGLSTDAQREDWVQVLEQATGAWRFAHSAGVCQCKLPRMSSIWSA